MKRREFIQTAAAGLAASAVTGEAQEARARVQGQGRPAVISSVNGLKGHDAAMAMLREGADTLDAALSVVARVEADPTDHSVGLGGLPNEDGVVQCDASVMHGPTRGAGSVAALEEIVHASQVAKKVMERTDHVLLVGGGALEFAVAMGFERQEMLTPEAREMWMKWKRDLSREDDWIDPAERLPDSMTPEARARALGIEYTTGTINCNVIDANGDISGVTTTSGLSYKIPGRVGDSPILGAGLYLDNDVGACGSTGRGEANLKTCASFLTVEFMRQGIGPEESALRACRRIVDHTVEPYLLDADGRPNFNVRFYAINKKGEFAGAEIWSGGQYAAHDGKEAKLHDCAYLFKRKEG